MSVQEAVYLGMFILVCIVAVCSTISAVRQYFSVKSEKVSETTIEWCIGSYAVIILALIIHWIL